MPIALELRVTDLDEAPFLPVVSDHVARALTNWLKDREQMQRPPEATAKVLAFVILLNDARVNAPDRSRPERFAFPTRPALAEHLQISVPSVDVCLSHRQGTRDISVVSRLKKGNIKSRISTIKFRLVIPKNEEMIRVVLTARSEDEAAHAAMRPKASARRKADAHED